MRWRVKKNGDGQARALALPANSKDLYEALRAAVVCGQACARDAGVIVFHGLWRGLAVLIATPQRSPLTQQRSEPRLKTSQTVHDRQLVHMLANMVLAAETGGSHVY